MASNNREGTRARARHGGGTPWDGIPVVLMVLAFVTTGCSDPDPSADSPPGAGVPDSLAIAAEVDPEVASEPVELSAVLHPLNDSGVSGTAMAVHSDDIVVIVIEAAGLPLPGEYPAALHQGNCAAGGEPLATLDPVIGLTDRTGESTTTLGSENVVLEGPLFIQVRGAGDVPLSCGDLPPHRSTRPFP